MDQLIDGAPYNAEKMVNKISQQKSVATLAFDTMTCSDIPLKVNKFNCFRCQNTASAFPQICMFCTDAEWHAFAFLRL